MATSILGEDKSVLEKIMEEVKGLDVDISNEKEFAAKEENLENTLEIREKQIAKEISDTLKARREEIEKTFDEEEKKLNLTSKRIKNKKEKQKDGKISERIKEETESFVIDNKTLQMDAKKLFKQSKVPGIYNTEVYYTLFMPKGIRDILICVTVFLLFFAALPTGMWFMFPEPRKEFLPVVLCLACVVIFGGLYLVIYTASRGKYLQVLNAGSNYRIKRRNNRKIIKKISNNIRKDKDETAYGLEDYNRQLQDLDMQKEDLDRKKKEALKLFDESTKISITEEIKARSIGEIEKLKNELTESTTELINLREIIKQKKIYIAENYEVFLGKENVNTQVLSEIGAIMEESGFNTIGEALEAYSRKKNEG